MSNLKIQPNKKKASPFILGTWNFGNDYWQELDQKKASQLIRTALNLKIDRIDTAAMYGNGISEQKIAHILSKLKRDKIISTIPKIDSKSILKSNRSIRKDIELSLKRMNLESLHTWYIHWPNRNIDPAFAIEELNRCKDDSLIKEIGISNFPVSEIKKALKGGAIDIHQMGWNLIWKTPEKEIVPFCIENKIKTVAYSPLAQGILTGKFEASPNANELRNRNHLIFFDKQLWPKIFALRAEWINALKKIGEFNLGAVATYWLLQQTSSPKIVIGASQKEQLTEIIKGQNQIERHKKEILATCNIFSQSVSTQIKKIFPNADNIFNHQW